MATVVADFSWFGLSSRVSRRLSTVPGRCKDQVKAIKWRISAQNSQSPSRKSDGVLMSLTNNRNRSKKQLKYSSVLTTDSPLYEPHGVSFDQYLDNTPRVLNALFPDEECQQLAEDTWRIKMLPVQLLFMNTQSVIETRVRCKSGKEVYLPQVVPNDVAKLFEFVIMEWKFEGLNFNLTDFNFYARGVIYPDRRQLQHRLKGHTEMSLSFAVPPILSLVPEHLVTNSFEQAMKDLVQYMNCNLMRDYNKYRTEQSFSYAPSSTEGQPGS